MVKKHWHMKGDMYVNDVHIDYFSKRYNKHVLVKVGYESDGATGARDILSDAWWVHDVLKEFKVFEDGSKCSNWQASNILSDILKRDGYWFRARSWFVTTLAWGTVVH